MRKIWLHLFVIVLLLITTIGTAQISFKTIQKDFHKLSGAWEGSLTYVDYSTGKPYTMPADLIIKRVGMTNKIVFSNIYPKETSANSIDTISILSDGKYIDQALVKSRRKLPNGEIEIITEEFGKDGNDNNAATLRHTYTLGKTIFKKRKDVQFIGKAEWINRNEYSYKKKSNQ